MKKAEKKHNFNEFWQPYTGVVDMEDLWDLSKKSFKTGKQHGLAGPTDPFLTSAGVTPDVKKVRLNPL